MMEEVFASFGFADRNFVEQFQTTGFDARVFELFLHAYFTGSGCALERADERPDFLVTNEGVAAAVEATTANPSQTPGTKAEPILGLDLERPIEDEAEMRARVDHEVAIRLGSALYSKLQKRYWSLPHVRGRALVFAVEAFYAHDSLLFSSAGLAQYLYGVKHEARFDADNRLRVHATPIEWHEQADKQIPSGFFAQPGAEHVSAVLFSNSGTVAKFTRMGFQAGLHRGNVIVIRNGLAYNHDPNAAHATPFVYRLDEDPGEEPWGSGVEVFHNPRALHPLSRRFFPDAMQWFIDDGALTSESLEFTPVNSATTRMHLQDEVLRPVDDQPSGVGTILRREFDSFDLVRPQLPPDLALPFGEVAWFADLARRLLGTVFRWYGSEHHGFVVLGKDAGGRWRAIDQDDGFVGRVAAAEELTRRMRDRLTSGQVTYETDA